jgi:hypothetical protein
MSVAPAPDASNTTGAAVPIDANRISKADAMAIVADFIVLSPFGHHRLDVRIHAAIHAPLMFRSDAA